MNRLNLQAIEASNINSDKTNSLIITQETETTTKN